MQSLQWRKAGLCAPSAAPCCGILWGETVASPWARPDHYVASLSTQSRQRCGTGQLLSYTHSLPSLALLLTAPSLSHQKLPVILQLTAPTTPQTLQSICLLYDLQSVMCRSSRTQFNARIFEPFLSCLFVGEPPFQVTGRPTQGLLCWSRSPWLIGVSEHVRDKCIPDNDEIVNIMKTSIVVMIIPKCLSTCHGLD